MMATQTTGPEPEWAWLSGAPLIAWLTAQTACW
jgi:hypothetical protein